MEVKGPLPEPRLYLTLGYYVLSGNILKPNIKHRFDNTISSPFPRAAQPIH